MKLIEKKCPNCGASLSFSDTDKSCKCEYCKRSFEIERCNDNSSNLSDNFSLNEFKTPAKFLSAYLIGSYISSIIVGTIVFIIIGFAGFTIFKGAYQMLKDDDILEKKSNKYFSNVSELSNDDYEEIDSKFENTFNSRAMGENNIKHYYRQDGDAKREVVYVASKEDGNFIIGIYKVYFYDIYYNEDRHTFYVPIVFENIKMGDVNNFKNPQIKAPEFYLNSDNSCFSYGYASLDEAYNNVVVPLEKDYKISKK